MNLNAYNMQEKFFFKSRDELVGELLTHITQNMEQLREMEETFVYSLQERFFKLKSYHCSNKQIRWLLIICDRLDYRHMDGDWWEEMRVNYIEKYK